MLSLIAISLMVQGDKVVRDVEVPYRGRLTTSAIRYRAPDLIWSLAKAVQERRAPMGSLVRLIGVDDAQKLSNNALLKNKIPKSLLGRPDGAKSSTSITDLMLHHMVPEHSPKELDFPPTYDGAHLDLTLHVTSETSGPVFASIPANPNFRIVEMKTLSGLLLPVPNGNSVQLIDAKKTSAPWTMEANEGQEVLVTVRFEPHLKLGSNTGGDKQTTLTVDGHEPKAKPGSNDQWKLTVPVKGRFQGENVGLLAYPHPSEIIYAEPDAYKPTQPYPIPVTVGLINLRDPVNGKVRAISLPDGMSASPAKDFSIIKGEAKDVTIHPTIMPMSKAWNKTDSPMPIRVEIDAGGKVFEAEFVLRTYEGWHFWSFNGIEVSSVTMNVSLLIGSSGYFEFHIAGSNSNIILSKVVNVEGFFDGKRYFVAASGAPRNGSFDTFQGGDKRSDLAQQFVDLSKKKLRYHIEVWTVK